MSLFRRLFSSSESDEEEQPTAAQETPVDTQPGAEAEQPESQPEILTEEPKVDDDATIPDRPVPTPPVTPAVTTPPPSAAGDGATRQLPAEKVISVNNARMTFGQATDVGMVRAHNEDAALSFFSTSRSVDDPPDFGIFIVADGMGGHHEGEVASAMAVRIVAENITRTVYAPMLAGQDMADLPPLTEVLIEAVQRANADIHTKIPKGGGTTCTATVVMGDRAYIAHVGDSRAYLVTKDSIEQITRDHSMVQRLIELGQLTPEERDTHPRGNELYRALGFKNELEVDALSRRLPPNSKLLICSDGLWNHVGEMEMMNLILNYPNPQDACNKLIALANSNGGTDNITAIILRMN